MSYGLTPRMRDIVDFIAAFSTERGYGPTLQEIGDHVGIASKSRVHRLVENLIDRGWLTRLPRAARSIALANPPANLNKPPRKDDAMTIEGFNPYEGGFIRIPVGPLVEGYLNGWSSAEMAKEYAKACTDVRVRDIDAALSSVRERLNATGRAA